MIAALRRAGFVLIVAIIVTLGFSVPAEAFLFHATRKSAAKRIMAKGIDPSKFSNKARFGKGFYGSRKASTAIAEKGESSSVVRAQESSYLKKNTLNFKNDVAGKLRSTLGPKADLRGAAKNDVIGPKAGHQIGKAAAKEGKAVEYRSVKNGGSNLFIPKSLFDRRPKIVQPDKVVR